MPPQDAYAREKFMRSGYGPQASLLLRSLPDACGAGGSSVGREDVNANLGISRRQLIRRSAVVAGTVVWATPVVQSLSTPAAAQVGSPACDCVLCFETVVGGMTTHFSCTLSVDSCHCLCCCTGIADSCSGCPVGPVPAACLFPVGIVSCVAPSPGPCP